MIITKANEENRITLLLEGWLDTEAAPALGEEIEKIEEAEEILLDMDKVEYMSSSGLRQIVAAYRKARELDASFSAVNVHPEIMSIFSLTGLDKKFTIKAAQV